MQIHKRHETGLRIACRQIMQSVSADQQQSPKQLAYNELFRKQCEASGVRHPFEFEDPKDTKKFFEDLQLEWAQYKDKHKMVD